LFSNCTGDIPPVMAVLLYWIVKHFNKTRILVTSAPV